MILDEYCKQDLIDMINEKGDKNAISYEIARAFLQNRITSVEVVELHNLLDKDY